MIVTYFDAPNVEAFVKAQSRLEVGNGKLFSTHLNFANVGNVDSNPKAGGGYATPEDAGLAYCHFLNPFGDGSGRYAQFIAAVRGGLSDVLQLATIIKAAGYATSPNYAAEVASWANYQP